MDMEENSFLSQHSTMVVCFFCSHSIVHPTIFTEAFKMLSVTARLARGVTLRTCRQAVPSLMTWFSTAAAVESATITAPHSKLVMDVARSAVDKVRGLAGSDIRWARALPPSLHMHETKRR